MKSLLCSALAVVVMGGLGGSAAAQSQTHTKYRVKIDSSPQQAAIYVNDKTQGIAGYTPSTLRLPRGVYNVIIELPGFKPMQRSVEVKRAQAFVFTLERAARPAVLDVRSTSNDSATGGQLFIDGTATGTVPGHVELPTGKHVVEVKKPGFKDFRDTMDAAEGDNRTMVVELTPELKKGAILVTSDADGAEVYVDGQRRDTAPTLVGDLPEGEHTVEVRKDPMPAFRQVVRVVAGQQMKVTASFQSGGVLRVVCSNPEAEVMVDGEPKGRVNTDIAVGRAGEHIVEVRAQGFPPQTIEVKIAAGEARVVKVDLGPGGAMGNMPPEGVGRLRVITAQPDAEVFVDGASMGKGSIDRRDLPAGKHFVVVRKAGFAEWKREVELQPGQGVSLTAELAASGTLKVLANVGGADVMLDGQPVGRTPVTLADVPSGDHLIEVRAPGFHEARQQIHLEGGEQKVLAAELVPHHTGPTAADMARRTRSASSFSAVTIDPARFTFDLAVGFLPFAEARLTVGAWRGGPRGMFGIDAGVGVRTDGYMTEAGAHAKFQFLKAGPVAIGTQLYLGGGGGPTSRNDFTFEWGLPISLLFGDIVRVTGNPYLQVSTDRLCPDVQTPGEPTVCHAGYGIAPAGKGDWDTRFGQSPRDRFVTTRFMLQAAIEVAVHQFATIFLIFEGAPTGPRAAYMGSSGTGYSPGFVWHDDPQVYGRLGVTFKF